MADDEREERGSGGAEDPIGGLDKLKPMLDRYYELHEWEKSTGVLSDTLIDKLFLSFIHEEEQP